MAAEKITCVKFLFFFRRNNAIVTVDFNDNMHVPIGTLNSSSLMKFGYGMLIYGSSPNFASYIMRI